MTLELGFFVPPITPGQFLEKVKTAEKYGYDFVTTDDHLIDPFTPPAGEQGGTYGCNESWTAMSFAAGATSRISISHMVLVASFRGPGLLAKMAATLDLFSRGRMDLTLGAGWYEPEFRAFGFPWEGHGERLKREREIVEIIRGLWSESPFSYEGRYYRLHNAVVAPGPFRNPGPPIWIGGDSKPSMRLAADLGDGWLIHGHKPREVKSMFSHIRPILGEREKGFGLGMAAFVVMASDPDQATKKLEKLISPELMANYQKAGIRHEINNRISGDTQQCLERIAEYRNLGLTRLITIFIDAEDAARFSEEVLPEIRRW